MILQRFATTNFFLADNRTVAFYLKGVTVNTLDLLQLLNQNFVALFSYSPIQDALLTAAQPNLDAKAGKKMLAWIQDGNLQVDISGGSLIDCTDIHNCALSIDLNADLVFTLQGAGGTYSVVMTDTGFAFTIANSTGQLANQVYTAEFAGFHIAVTGADLGAVHIDQVTGPVENRLQPVAPYLTNKNRILPVEHFDQASFNGLDQHAVFYHPYPKANLVEGDAGGPVSYCQHSSTAGVRMNLLSDDGSHVLVKNGFQSNLSLVEYTVGEKNYPYYYFIPMGDYSYSLMGSVNSYLPNVLAGFSGTERLNVPAAGTMTFVQQTNVQVDAAGETLVPAGQNGRSRSAAISFQGVTPYYTDAERSPAFVNENSTATTSLETGYQPVPMGIIPGGTSFPILPTLAHKDENYHLLGNVFTRQRISKFNSAAVAASSAALSAAPMAPPPPPATAYVTPQGFLRNGNTLQFIKPPQGTPAGGIFTFQVDNVTLSSDFNLSLAKEDVFFVLSPDMLAGKTEKFTVTYTLGGFTIELDVFNSGGAGSGPKDTYLIFKFSKRPLNELLADPSLWSNYDNYQAADAQALISDIKAKMAAPATSAAADYAYLNKTIQTDPNWNGVLLLNIPLSDMGDVPDLFGGLCASQDLAGHPGLTGPSAGGPGSGLLQFTKGLRFQYVAFPVNRTVINNGAIDIKTTSLYGLIDYDLLPDDQPGIDRSTITNYFGATDGIYRFLLTKLLVRFENSEIVNFTSYAFLQIPSLFEDSVSFAGTPLSNQSPSALPPVPNLVRMNGSYQKDSSGREEFRFELDSAIIIQLPATFILQTITITKIAFTYVDGAANPYRFYLDASAQFHQGDPTTALWNMFSFKGLQFQNIGLSFSLGKLPGGQFSIPLPSFDLSGLLVLPDIKFDGSGLLGSFPITFSGFQSFPLSLGGSAGQWKLDFPGIDFFRLHFSPPAIDLTLPTITLPNLFSFLFDLDLGTLGNLGGLKGLKAQLLLGWSLKGGWAAGLRLNGPSVDGLHLNLFGAVKLDITQLNLCHTGNQFTIRILDARLTIFGLQLPSSSKYFNALIFAKPGDSTAWLMAYETDPDPAKAKLLLGIGQRVTLGGINSINSVQQAVDAVKAVFDPKLDPCKTGVPASYSAAQNWLVASDSLLPDDWPIELAFIFNDPVLYGLHLGFRNGLLSGFAFDILYKKISDSVGVYALDFALPDEVRNHDTGGIYFRLPDLGIDIYTNGDWKVDVGWPVNDNDWSRSGFIQLRTVPPFVGWFGFYLMKSTLASQTLFAGYIGDDYSQAKLTIIQLGFAMRVGLGAYIDAGIFYAGASITVYCILEGAAAFEKGQGLASLFPDHFAISGRTGAIAELIGYVDFSIIKLSVRISLRVEFGLLLVYLSKNGSDVLLDDNGKPVMGSDGKPILFNSQNPQQKTGIQPVVLYVEGEVSVQITITIGCIDINLSFDAYVRFSFTIGGGGSGSGSTRQTKSLSFSQLALLTGGSATIDIPDIGAIPMVYLPGYSDRKENGQSEQFLLVHSFIIPFFGIGHTDPTNPGSAIQFSRRNIVKDSILYPLFNNLLAKLPQDSQTPYNSYSNLRNVLLEGYYLNAGGAKIPVALTFSNYQPTFVHGINTQDNGELKNLLTRLFLFNNSETSGYNNPGTGQAIKDAYGSSLKVIPAPVSTHIQAVDTNNTVIPLAAGTHTITVNGLVAAAGQPAGSNSIVYSFDTITRAQSVIDHMTGFYDDCKIQFINKSEAAGLSAAPFDTPVDIRTGVIIPEFFKLMGLLTLEAMFRDIRQKLDPAYRKSVTIDPVFTMHPNSTVADPDDPSHRLDGTIDYSYSYIDKNGVTQTITGNWNPNDRLESIIGQLNYFYHNGLRLPGDLTGNTLSLYDLLSQASAITAIDHSAPDAASKVKVQLDGVDITGDIFATAPDIQSMWKYVDGYATHFALANLKQEFSPAGFAQPFHLQPVALAIQNGLLSCTVSQGGSAVPARFFSLPAKLLQQGGSGANYTYTVHNANVNTDQDSTALFTAINCLNIEVLVRQRSPRVLEIVNVYAADLDRMAQLYTANIGANIGNIGIYYEPAAPAGGVQQPIELNNLLIDGGGTARTAYILKTNLSPRTTPPLEHTGGTALESLAADAPASGVYWEDAAASKGNFIRLLWEALATNSGGYYIVLDRTDFNPAAGGAATGATDLKLLLSFSLTGSVVPGFFNALQLIDTSGQVLPGLDNKTNYLYLGQLTSNGQAVLEYHPTVPAHTLDIKVMRDTSRTDTGSLPYAKSNYNKYLPLEYSLADGATGASLLSADKVLPIMPRNQTDTSGKPIYQYQQIVPLVAQPADDASGANLVRYSAIGKTFTLQMALRDSYGFRTSVALDPATYTHFYFDKLIPPASWPLISFPYWTKQPGGTGAPFLFSLDCTCNVLGLLDMAGIPRKPDPANPGQYIYAYAPGDKVTDAGDIEKLENVIPGVKNHLNTIEAQLTDALTQVLVNGVADAGYKEDLRSFVHTLNAQLNAQVSGSALTLPGNVQAPGPKDLVPTLSAALKNPIGFTLGLTRPTQNTLANPKAAAQFAYDPGLFGGGNSPIWEFGTTFQVTSTLQPAQSSLADLDTAIQTASQHRYTLGLSTDAKTNARVLYLVDKGTLGGIGITSADAGSRVLDMNTCYYGIEPYSNQLWSGVFKSIPLLNVDLDVALNTVTAKIDELLGGGAVGTNFTGGNKMLYDSLVAAKNAIVRQKLDKKIGLVMDSADAPPAAAMVSAFDDILLEQLHNFYAYDGVILAKLNVNDADAGKVDLGADRLTIAVDPVTGYILSPSKAAKNSDWYILFDQTANQGNIQLSINASITHLETNITTLPGTDNIQESTWIQLVSPIGIGTGAYTANAWPYLIREYPDKPIILSSAATQYYQDGDAAVSSWLDATGVCNLGIWQYQLVLKNDPAYAQYDKMKIVTVLGTLAGTLEAGLDVLNFEGFAAYWAANIGAAAGAGWTNFVQDLAAQFPATAGTAATLGAAVEPEDLTAAGTSEATPAGANPTFWIVNTGAGWTLDTTNPLPAVLAGKVKVTSDASGITVTIGPFNVFDAGDKIASVLPQVTVYRNLEVANPAFHYATDTVQPATAATPHIQYYNAIALNTVTMQAVFDLAAGMKLPYKATAKFLVNTANLDSDRSVKLPAIPVRQMELGLLANGAGSPPATNPFDNTFTGFFYNGYPALSLTIYSNAGSVGDLPVFSAATLYKPCVGPR